MIFGIHGDLLVLIECILAMLTQETLNELKMTSTCVGQLNDVIFCC